LLFSPAAQAAERTPETMAASLKELGLFVGTDKGFELDKPCDRLMGAVILTRLLGDEQEAVTTPFSHPFLDVQGSYAEPYIGYLYQQGLTNGISATAYGKDAMSGQQFATLILRALGYQDGLDFSWNTALDTLADLQILSVAEAQELAGSSFLRQGAVLLCYRALLTVPKNAEHPLLYNLLWQDVFTTQQLARSKDAQLLLAADMPDFMGYAVNVYTEQEFSDIFWLSLRNRQSNLSIYAPEIMPLQARSLVGGLLAPYDQRDFFIDSFRYEKGYYDITTYSSEYMAMQFYYEEPMRYQKNFQIYQPEYWQPRGDYISLYLWRDKLEKIVNATTSPQMNEYERLKALHDYLVLNTAYDDQADPYSKSHFADGALFDGKAACDGFASALKMLLNAAGIESLVVFGETPEGSHAWNQVEIDGEWYNVDATWANTMGQGSVYYGYFCAPDDIFLRDHWPRKSSILYSCTSSKYFGQQ